MAIDDFELGAENPSFELIDVALDAFFTAADEAAWLTAVWSHLILRADQIDAIIRAIAIEEPEIEARRAIEARQIWLTQVRTRPDGSRDLQEFLSAVALLAVFERQGRGSI
jgi:hypothetical protein